MNKVKYEQHHGKKLEEVIFNIKFVLAAMAATVFFIIIMIWQLTRWMTQHEGQTHEDDHDMMFELARSNSEKIASLRSSMARFEKEMNEKLDKIHITKELCTRKPKIF